MTNSAGPLKPNAQAAADAITASGCSFTSMGGTRSSAIDPNGHPSGNAIDVMVGLDNMSAGNCVVDFVSANWAALKIDYIIWQQAIKTSANGAWQPMEDRGSPTQNHRDHVHVQTKP